MSGRETKTDREVNKSERDDSVCCSEVFLENAYFYPAYKDSFELKQGGLLLTAAALPDGKERETERQRELEWEVRGTGNSWPSLVCSEFKRQWAGDINSPQPQASEHTHTHTVLKRLRF